MRLLEQKKATDKRRESRAKSRSEKDYMSKDREKEKENESDMWIPYEAYDIAHRFRKSTASTEIPEEFINTLLDTVLFLFCVFLNFSCAL